MLTLGWGPAFCLTGWATSPGSGLDGGGVSVGVILKNIDLGEGENWLGLFWVLGQFEVLEYVDFVLGFLFLFFFPLYMHPKWLQSCPTLSDPMDCGPPGSSVHGVLQASVLEWVAMPFSRGSTLPRDQSASLALSPALPKDSLLLSLWGCSWSLYWD